MLYEAVRIVHRTGCTNRDNRWPPIVRVRWGVRLVRHRTAGPYDNYRSIRWISCCTMGIVRVRCTIRMGRTPHRTRTMGGHLLSRFVQARTMYDSYSFVRVSYRYRTGIVPVRWPVRRLLRLLSYAYDARFVRHRTGYLMTHNFINTGQDDVYDSLLERLFKDLFNKLLYILMCWLPSEI